MDEEKDVVYEYMADGRPKLRFNIESRANLTYPLLSEYLLVELHRRHKSEMSLDYEDVLSWVKESIPGMKYKNELLNFEIEHATKIKGKSIDDILNQVILDLQNTKDEGMTEEKYHPLIKIEENKILLTEYALILFDD